jgi:hypothetical protein
MIRGVQNAKGDQEYDRLFKAFKNEVIAMPTVLETICHDTEEWKRSKTGLSVLASQTRLSIPWQNASTGEKWYTTETPTYDNSSYMCSMHEW